MLPEIRVAGRNVYDQKMSNSQYKLQKNSRQQKVKLVEKLSLYFFTCWCQFHQCFTRVLFVQKFVQSQNVTRKNAFVCKIRAFNVDEIDPKSCKKSKFLTNSR
jgi:hypothetical protein